MANTTLASKNKKAFSLIDNKLLEDVNTREVFPHLPDTSTYKIVRRSVDGGTLAIQMGPHKGRPVFLTAEGKAVSTGHKNRKVNIQDDVPWDDSFIAPGVFSWKAWIRNALREPMEPFTLALVQYQCLRKSVEDDLDLKVPIPKFGDLLNAISQLEASSAFRSWRDKTERNFASISGSQVPSFRETEFDRSDQSNTTSVARIPRSPSSSVVIRSRSKSVDPATSNIENTRKPIGKTEARLPSRRERVDLGNNSIDFANIVVPEQEVDREGPISRSQMRAMAAATPRDHADSSKSGSRSCEDKAVPKSKHQNVIPAGPEALQVLRQQVAPHLLARLPNMSALKFSEHGKPIHHARLRLLVGTYGQKDMARWTNDVYAYFKFGKHLRLDPKMYMEVAQHFGSGYEHIQVTWEHDIVTNRIDLEDFAKKANNNAELKALIKYCFLIATEVELLGAERHFVPIHTTFVNHLTAICKEWDSRITDIEVSAVCYSDVSKVPARLAKSLDRGKRKPDLLRPGVAQVKAQPVTDWDASDSSDSEDNELGEHFASKGNVKSPTGWSLIQERLAMGAVRGLSASSGRSPKHEKERRDRRKAKSSAVFSNHIANRRPPSDNNDTASMMALKNEDKVLSGRIQKDKQEVEDYYAKRLKEIQRRKAELDEIRVKIREKEARGGETEATSVTSSES